MRSYIEVDPIIRNKAVLESVDEPIIIRVTSFDENGVRLFEENMQKAHRNHQPVIPIVIDSYGGSVYCAFAMVDSIKAAKKPVVTISEGKSMSAGSFLLAFGTKGYRYAAENSTILIHDMTHGDWGKTDEIVATAKQAEKLNRRYFKMLAEQCEQPRDFFLNKLHEKDHVNWYLTSKEAKQIKLVDHIGIPEIVLKISLDYKFGLNLKES